jgi:chromosome segregation ATPase
MHHSKEPTRHGKLAMIQGRRPRSTLAPGSALETGSGSGDPPDMQEIFTRFDRIETEMSDIKGVLRQLTPALTGIQESVAISRAEMAVMKEGMIGFKAEMTVLRGEMTGFKTGLTDLKGEMTGLKEEVSGLKEGMAGLKLEMQEGMAGLKLEMQDVRHDVADVKHSFTTIQETQVQARDTLTATRETLFEVKGRVSELPSTWQLLTLLVGTVMAVFTVSLAIPRLLP